MMSSSQAPAYVGQSFNVSIPLGTAPGSSYYTQAPAVCPRCGRCNTCGQVAPPPIPAYPWYPYAGPTWVGVSNSSGAYC